MKCYRIYSNKHPLCQFPYALINSIVVIAENEEEAHKIVEQERGDNFVCEQHEREIEIIAENLNEPLIVAIEYFSQNY